jgi:hypothetical protein
MNIYVSRIRENARAIRDMVRQDVGTSAISQVYSAVRPFEDGISRFFGGTWVEPKERLSVTPYQELSSGVRVGFSRNAEQPIEVYKQQNGAIRQLYERDTIFCMRVREDRARNWLALEFDEDVGTVLRAKSLKILVCGKANRPTSIQPTVYFNRRDRDNVEVESTIGVLSEFNNRAVFDVTLPKSVVSDKSQFIASKLVLKVRDNANCEFKLFDLRVFGMR